MDSLIGRATLAALPLALTACSSGAPSWHESAELRAGDYRLVLDDRPTVRLLRVDDELLRLEGDGLELGLAGPTDDLTNYDPYRRFVPIGLYIPPVEPTFLPATSAAFEPSDADTLRLTLRYDDTHQATLDAAVGGDGRFSLRLTPTKGVDDVAYLDVRPRVSSDEGFYGLGELSDDVNQRGKVRAMQLELETTTEAGYNDAHAPVPLLVGTRGWGLFVESRRPGAFAVATEATNLVTASFGVGTAAKDGLGFHLFGATHPLDVTKRYYDVTGYPALPARWALGPWVWRDENEDQAEFEHDLETLRDLDLPTTGVWLDRPYATGVNTFDFDAKRFPNAQGAIDKAHALGMRVALWHTPYLDESDPATETLRAEAESKGYFPTKHGLKLNKWGTLLDVTNPAAVAFWRGLLTAYTSMGIEGFKLDYAEDVVLGPTANRSPWTFHDGSDERTAHSAIQLAYHGAYAPLLPNEGGFLLTRAARYGDQVHGLVMWPGDLDATFAKRGDSMADGATTYVATGGLPTALINGLSLSATGFPFFASDTGGYRHSPPDNELFSRWFEMSALGTSMEVGTSTNDVPWEATPANGFDAALLDRYRAYARLHVRLFPYIWSYATRLASDGRPITRPLGLAYPELGAHPNDTFLLGDELLVAPVLERGKTARDVIFPPGTWVHWFTGEAFDGDALAGKPTRVEAPIGRLPLFVRAAGLVPLLRPTIDAIATTTDPARVDSYATDPGVLWVRGVAQRTGRFTLFDGGAVAQRTVGKTTTLHVEPGDELAKGAVFELMLADEPASVSNGAPLATRNNAADVASAGGVFYDTNAHTLYVRVPPTGGDITVTWK